ncbi:MAG: hypothetical protein QMD50_03715 [Patescibacteria group bacterium]|nr:hypothetical protein [Patescibacteria group bacterium]
MNIEKGPSDKNGIEDAELAREMASIENSVRKWAKRLAEAIKDPDKADASKLPPWAATENVFVRLDLYNMIGMGVTPEDAVAYGEECAEKVEHLAKYTEGLDGMTKMQLLREYFNQFIDGFTNKAKRNKTYNESKRTPLALAPEMVAQPKEYRDAQIAYEETIEKRALVWDRIKHRQPEK